MAPSEDAALAGISAVERVREEIEAARASPEGFPDGVESLSDPVAARYVTFPQGTACGSGVVPNPDPETGPWHVIARVRGPPDSGYHLAAQKVRLSFSEDYPRVPPDVHILSKCQHALLDPDREVSSLFYHPTNLPPARVPTADSADSSAVSQYDLRAVLRTVRAFLSAPLHIPDPDEDARAASDASEGSSASSPPSIDSPASRERRRLARAWTAAAKLNLEREAIVEAYVRGGAGGGPVYPRLFDGERGWPASFFHPDLVLAASTRVDDRVVLDPNAARRLCEEVVPGIWTFPLLSDVGCDALVEEMEHFQRDSGLPVRQPNSMNRYGVVLDGAGMEAAFDRLQADILGPIAEALFPEHGGGSLDGHHAFAVQYREGAELGLDMHTDDSDVTFNACLGKTFEGAGLTFCGVLGGDAHRRHSLAYAHVKGRCVVHLGAHRHGADDLASGERVNLIVWNHSATFRRSDAYQWKDIPDETQPPDPRCLSYTHDKDFAAYRAYPPGAERFASSAWYPPSRGGE